MKALLCAVVSLFSLPAFSQTRPIRLTAGAAGGSSGSLMMGLSVDGKNLPKQRTLSLYADAAFTLGFGCAAVVIENPLPATEFEGYTSFGVSLRQNLQCCWFGVGIGSYQVHFGGCSTRERSRMGLGGKLFAGVGQGVFLSEFSVVVPSEIRQLQLGLTVGLRL
jgi:hypothetical protein